MLIIVNIEGQLISKSGVLFNLELKQNLYEKLILYKGNEKQII